MAPITGHGKYIESICWHCENCTKCNWGRYDKKKGKVNFGAVRGWKVKHERGGITVLECPQYIPDARYEAEQAEKDGIPAEARAALMVRRDELAGLSRYNRKKAVRRIYREAGFCACGRKPMEGKKICENCNGYNIHYNALRRQRRKIKECKADCQKVEK